MSDNEHEVTNPVNDGQSGSNPPTPAPQSAPQSAPQPQPHSAPAQPAGTPFVAELRDALNALPERLVNALREATPQPTPARKSKNDDSDSDTRVTVAKETPAQTPGTPSFADWWFKT